MELRQLRHFVAVAEEGNISRAAKRIFLTQPALSRQIKALEEELGQCLLERQAHSISLTPAGRLLLQEARELLACADRLLERVRAANRKVLLRVGYAPSLAADFLSAAVANFTQTHSGATVQLFDQSTAEMLAGLENGTIDLAISARPEPPPRGLEWMPLERGAWKLAVPRGHPLANRKTAGAADVAKGPLLAFCQRDYPEYWAVLAGWLRAHRQRPQVAAEFDGVDSLLAGVAAGLGMALVAPRSPRLVPERVVLKTLSDPPPPLCIAAGYRADRAADKPLAVLLAELRRARSGAS